MQTFLPYARFDASAAVLDDQRLGKQRVETMQILRALVFPSYKGWKHHPATAMWRGFTSALVSYGVAMCDEWERRGHADAVRRSLLEFAGGAAAEEEDLRVHGRLPPWLGSAAFHASHRASLVAKLPEHYGALFPDADPGLPYHWPKPMFPRWPIRRTRPLRTAAALTALGVTDEAALDDHGRALLAALQSAGPTVWVHDAPLDRAPPPPARLRPPVAAKRPGKVVASVARPPTPADVASVRAEVRTPPFVHVYHERWLGEPKVRAAAPDATLAVLVGPVDERRVRRRFAAAEVLRLPGGQ
jgi:hypothetical protein